MKKTNTIIFIIILLIIAGIIYLILSKKKSIFGISLTPVIDNTKNLTEQEIDTSIRTQLQEAYKQGNRITYQSLYVSLCKNYGLDRVRTIVIKIINEGLIDDPERG